MSAVTRLDRIVLNVVDPDAVAIFYERALGFTREGNDNVAERALAQLLGLPDARAQIVTLCLGMQRLDLMCVTPAGRPYPPDVPGPSALFQHFAIEVPDIDVAFARLQAHAGWRAISQDGPQLLPPNTGSVTAFKFRDPQGHPLELICVPGHGHLAPAINHSAISVGSDAVSMRFYAALGFDRTGGSLNSGPAQERLDDLAGTRVTVTALNAGETPEPHVELLCYAEGFTTAVPPTAPHDIAATWLVFAVPTDADLEALTRQATHGRCAPVRFADGALRSLFRDPDGHWLCLETAATKPDQPPVAKPG